jgi:uncharacterized protein (TIGR03083 family)
MVATSLSHARTGAGIKQAKDIAPVTRHEAAQLAADEIDRLLDLLEQLDGDNWTQSTDCTEWTVHDMTAHLAGACAGWASWKHFRRQIIFNPHIRKADVPVDAINRRQIEDRAGQTPQQFIDELREVGPKAVRNRKKLPGILRKIRIDAKPMPGKMSMAYLVDVIYPRDQWMHRLDICRATGKHLVITPDHDGRLLDLVMLDIAKTLAGEIAITVNVTGALAAAYRFGSGEPQAELDIDFLTLNRRASMRITADEARETVTMRGDRAAAERFLQHCKILY